MIIIINLMIYFPIKQTYVMSRGVRGRASIINIENLNGRNALQLRRKGSCIDVKNLKYMLHSLGFEIAKVVENANAKVSIFLRL